jgi:hypothetical protein
MTTFNYAKPKANATKMLTRYGQSLTITHHSVGAYDVSLGTATDTTITQTGIGVIFEWGQQGSTPSYGQSNIPGTLIADGDKQMYLSTVGITIPHVNDNVTDVNGVVYIIKMIKPLMPAGVSVLYECNINGI